MVEQNNYVTVFGLPCEERKIVLPPLSFPYPSTQKGKAGTIRYANGKLLMYENKLYSGNQEWVTSVRDSGNVTQNECSIPWENMLCWDIMKISAKCQLTTVLCVLVGGKGEGMLSMCNHIYWLFGDNLLKTSCGPHSLARAVCYGKVTPWPFGFGPRGKRGPVWPGVPFLCRETWNFNNLLCGVVLLYQPVQISTMHRQTSTRVLTCLMD